jgi:fatty-acyl-CoA synthase
MQRQPLLISSIIRHAARHHGRTEVISKQADGSIHRTDYATVERRARRMAMALHGLGVQPGDRVATLAMNGYRHLELYYAISGMGAICHTINPRLAIDDIAYILGHAEDVVLCADPFFAGILEALAVRMPTVRHIVILGEEAELPKLSGPAALHSYEALMAGSDEAFDWPLFDEDTASSLCYTSGTTGRPKGVLYSHRSTLLHGLANNAPDALGLRAVDRVLPVVPMFHANAWSLPYGAPMVGAALVFPGRHLDAPSLVNLLNAERVTMTAGVPTIWLGVLQHLRETGQKLPHLKRMMAGGSAVPRALNAAFLREYGVVIQQGWGMTESSPIATISGLTPETAELDEDGLLDLYALQGRTVYGVDVRAVREDGTEAPWDGKTPGNIQFHGHWVASGYYRQPETQVGDDGWFPTGDVGTFDGHGFVRLTDRTKDLIKSGGEWISSIDLENVAVGHPDVAEAAAIAAAHPKWVERPLLLVVAKPGRAVTEASVLDYLKGKVANWWLPDAVLVVDGLPHGATGKIQKTVLREQYGGYFSAG